MSHEEMRRTAKTLLILRDAVQSAKDWPDVAGQIEKRGASLEEVRSRLAPRIEFDPHCHTIHSDGQLTYEQLLYWCKAVGLLGVGVTDHDNIHPSIADAIDMAEALDLYLVPGIEFTLHRLAGQSWSGLELGLHFFPPRAFADFIRSDNSATFRQRLEHSAQQKSEQGWGALDAVNERLLAPRDLRPITREELWNVSGRVDPVCPSSLTLLIFKRILESQSDELTAEFPNTRTIYTHMQSNRLAPPGRGAPQTFDDLVAMRRELAAGGVRSCVTLNHPEEWLTKCGLTIEDGSPDLPGIRRLALQLLLRAPDEAPISFIELHSARNTPESLRTFIALLHELDELRRRFLPQLSPLQPITSTDSHRILGALDAGGEPTGWAPGEDFVFGIGAIDETYPTGNLRPPDDYPGAEEIIAMMDERAT